MAALKATEFSYLTSPGWHLNNFKLMHSIFIIIYLYFIAQIKGLTNMNQASRNLTLVKWAHAVNSQKELSEALNSNIDMIEADIILGKLHENDDQEIPVMGHPPATKSDISLKQFLEKIISYNNKNNDIKGIKLDFKSTKVFEESIEIIQSYYSMIFFPLWLNADILPGPVNSTIIPVDSNIFLKFSKELKKAILSIGWTTQWGSNYTEGFYSDDQINSMISVILDNNLSPGQQITFPVRAGIAAKSTKTLYNLYNTLKGSYQLSLTIWSSPKDNVDIEQLRNLIFLFGVNNIYLDVPKEISTKLRLDIPNSAECLIQNCNT